MATRQNVPQSVEQSKLAVVPFPESSQAVSQLELATLLSLKNRARQLAEQVETAEKSIRTRLEAGACVEEGDHTAKLKENSRRNVAWREVAERLGDRLYGDGEGGPYCPRVLNSTKPTRTVSLELR